MNCFFINLVSCDNKKDDLGTIFFVNGGDISDAVKSVKGSGHKYVILRNCNYSNKSEIYKQIFPLINNGITERVVLFNDKNDTVFNGLPSVFLNIVKVDYKSKLIFEQLKGFPEGFPNQSNLNDSEILIKNELIKSLNDFYLRDCTTNVNLNIINSITKKVPSIATGRLIIRCENVAQLRTIAEKFSSTNPSVRYINIHFDQAVNTISISNETIDVLLGKFTNCVTFKTNKSVDLSVRDYIKSRHLSVLDLPEVESYNLNVDLKGLENHDIVLIKECIVTLNTCHPDNKKPFIDFIK